MCHAPIRVMVRSGITDIVPCGRCIQCRIHKKAAWTGRVVLEQLSQPTVSRVLTLTFDPDALVELHPDGFLVESVFESFIRRYRRACGPVRFFGCGEYGEVDGRPHWHVILFGHPPSAKALAHPKHWLPEELRPWWHYGFVTDDVVDLQAAAYVAGYTLKKFRGHAEQPILKSSRYPSGIGIAPIRVMGARFALSLHGRTPEALPTHYTIGGKKFPFFGYGAQVFKKSYLQSGGKLPPELPYEAQVERLVEYMGSRMQNVEMAKRWEELERDNPLQVRSSHRRTSL